MDRAAQIVQRLRAVSPLALAAPGLARGRFLALRSNLPTQRGVLPGTHPSLARATLRQPARSSIQRLRTPAGAAVRRADLPGYSRGAGRSARLSGRYGAQAQRCGRVDRADLFCAQRPTAERRRAKPLLRSAATAAAVTGRQGDKVTSCCFK